MADLAITFHWPPAQLDELSLAELMDWRERARKRASPDGSQ
ncbi:MULTISPECIES: GpE family phage tail protein [Pseudomonas]|nr:MULTISPECIES: GpE family phage tail protein [Pseudomonas]MCG7375217.1 GpE family phage tail protein [Pseudomonas luteola]